ncbi:MAG: hypothetical protein ABW157_07470, partial [Candidatus Thiodiazotropha sp. LLP2]
VSLIVGTLLSWRIMTPIRGMGGDHLIGTLITSRSSPPPSTQRNTGMGENRLKVFVSYSE